MKVPVCRGAAGGGGGGGGAEYFCNLLHRRRGCGTRGPVRGRVLLPRVGLEWSPPPRAGTQPRLTRRGIQARTPGAAARSGGGLGAGEPSSLSAVTPKGSAAEPKRWPPRVARGVETFAFRTGCLADERRLMPQYPVSALPRLCEDAARTAWQDSRCM